MLKRCSQKKESILGVAFGFFVSACLLLILNATFALTTFDRVSISATVDRFITMAPFLGCVVIARVVLSKWRWLTLRPLLSWPAVGVACVPILYLSVLIREAIITKQFTESCCYESFNPLLWIIVVTLTILLGLAFGYFQKRIYPSTFK